MTPAERNAYRRELTIRLAVGLIHPDVFKDRDVVTVAVDIAQVIVEKLDALEAADVLRGDPASLGADPEHKPQ